MSQDSMSVLEPFRSTLDQLDLQLEEMLAANSNESRQELAEQLSEGWQVLAEQLVEAGTPALMDLIALYAENLDLLLASRENGLPASEQSLLQRWHEACRHYLQAPADEKVIVAWVSLLQDSAWREPLHEDDAAELINGLVEFAGSTTEAPAAATSEEIVHDENELQTDDEPFIEPLSDRPVEPVDLALVHMISEVFGKVADDLTHALAKFNCASLADYQQSLSANDFLLENINKACETVGLFGLSYVFRRLWLNVVAKAADDHDYDAECNLFGIALILIQEYLTDIGNDTHCSALVRHLHEPGWRRPLPDAMQGRLFEALNVPVTDPDAQRASLERTIAGPDDVSLAIPGDVDGELVQALLHELPILTESFSAAIQAIIDADASQPRLLEAQRIAHTLKGACNTIGVHGIANLTHSLEAILEALNAEQALPGRELGAVLLDAADCLAAMSECLQGLGAAPEQALVVLQQVLDWDYRIKKEGLAGLDVSNGAPKADVPAGAENTGQDDDRAKAKTHIPSAMLDQIIEAAAEAGSIGERVHDKIGSLLNGSDEVRELTWRLSELVAEMDRLVNIQSVTARDSRGSQAFDELELEQYSEVHTCLSRLAEAAADVREQNAQMHRQLLDGKNLLIEQRNTQKENLERVQNLRLVPVQRIVPRCQRIVRQTARMTGKEVELQISGENTLIDSEILNGLTDALMHLLRNAVDHGIEAPENRLQAGKPRQGIIRLSFTNDRNALTISCEDDGSGLDTAKIGATAQARGWVTDQQALSDEQIQRLIFRPGFSTKEQVSHVSGRGIGMDAIQAQVASMNGVMDLASKPGYGLSVTINVPSNRYDAPMILVKTGGQTFAVSEHGIGHIFCALDGRLAVDADGSLHYQVEEYRYAANTLDNLLGLEGKNRIPDKAAGLLFKARNGSEQVVLVDQVIGYKNLMIRPFGDYLKGVFGVLGGVMLGSGQVAPVIDLFELISDAERRANADQFTALTPARPRAAKTLALVVDDSLSARKATVQLLKDAGFEVQTAIDGLDAIEKIEAQKPDIILSDLEMPRMNGIELTRYLRAMPDLKAIPLIMVTSRSSEKHRNQADNAGVTLYLTKPFSEDDLIIKLNGLLARKLIQAA
jgi:chemotaxis protein histidine kinase CheA/ActR/RegA family two-component response regulator